MLLGTITLPLYDKLTARDAGDDISGKVAKACKGVSENS